MATRKLKSIRASQQRWGVLWEGSREDLTTKAQIPADWLEGLTIERGGPRQRRFVTDDGRSIKVRLETRCRFIVWYGYTRNEAVAFAHQSEVEQHVCSDLAHAKRIRADGGELLDSVDQIEREALDHDTRFRAFIKQINCNNLRADR